jgi:ferric-dicitrate binding protein FerR (iron transport regulator)
MENARIIELMAKKLGKAASAAELEELRLLSGAYPKYGYLEEVVQSLQGNREHFEPNVPAQELTDSGWKHLAGRLNQKEETTAADEPEAVKVRSPWTQRLAVAATVLLLGAGAAWYFQMERRHTPQPGKSLDVRFGTQQTIVLADGTRIRLNAGSHLDYPETFTGATREVTLTGEAFFDVAPRASMPFLVHAGKLTIKVLGTTFDVKAYKEDADITTTLITGKVQVTMDNDPERNVILEPHEKLVVAKMDTAAIPASAFRNELRYQVRYLLPGARDSLAETAWLDNRLVFNDEAFGEVAKELERKYNVQIGFGGQDGEDLKEEHLSGVFDKETLPQVLDILRMTTRFEYRMDGRQIVIVKALK